MQRESEKIFQSLEEEKEDSAILEVEVEDEESETSILADAFNYSDDEFDVNERMTDPSAFNQTNLIDFPPIQEEDPALESSLQSI